MICEVYFTRIMNTDEKKYGFCGTPDGRDGYIPGHLVEQFDLDESDVGTKNMVNIIDDPQGKVDFVVTTLLIDEDALTAAKAEVSRLTEILDAEGIDY